MPNRRPCINTRTDNFHFSVGFDPETGNPVEFFITGRGKVGQDLDIELYELSVKASKLMQAEHLSKNTFVKTLLDWRYPNYDSSDYITGPPQ